VAIDERTDAVKAPEKYLRIGAAPENRRQMMTKLAWLGTNMLYLAGLVADLLNTHRSTSATVLGWTGLLAFGAVYLVLVLMPREAGAPEKKHLVCLVAIFVLAVAFSFIYRDEWLALFVYVSVACGAVLPFRRARLAVPGTTGVMIITSLLSHSSSTAIYIALPTLLGGAAMVGVQAMVRTMAELREARETVAHLAASDERLRLARDLHDLLGHSMSLITLKSELAGRMLPDHPEAAAQQVADIEQVSRQALKDVREAVTGYRRPTLDVELAGVRITLGTAQIEAQFIALEPATRPGLGPDEESALAWTLREAVTNVVRHSRATTCEIALDQVLDDDGRFVSLQITDNGVGPARSGRGNGLTGLHERLEATGGRLESGPGPRGKGFRLRALVPCRAVAAVGEEAA
jgi:two-component system, NarL family, sensor histidine kinase DesK